MRLIIVCDAPTSARRIARKASTSMATPELHADEGIIGMGESGALHRTGPLRSNGEMNRLRAAQHVRSEHGWIEADAGPQ
jgi:hypothetical protein